MTPSPSPGRVETLNGTSIYFEVHGAGEPILLLHGFTGSSEDWASVAADWGKSVRVIVPDLRGHGRSALLNGPFRHDEGAADMLALLDYLGVRTVRAVGMSGGGNILLHIATKYPDRVKAMVLVSATPYFPPQARAIMQRYPDTLSDEQLNILRRRHPGGDAQIRGLMNAARAFAGSYDDLNFTPPLLSRIQARTLIVQGDRDPLYPVELSVEMARAIPQSALWIVPNTGHGPVIGDHWAEFLKVAAAFLA